MDNARIKENIIRIRTKKGISQDEMARSLDISRNSYRSIEKGSTYVINRRLHDIAERLGVSEEELVLGYQPIESEESLEDIRRHYQMSEDEIKTSADIRIAELERKVASQKEIIDGLHEIIDAKNEIIDLLKRNAKSR